MITRTQMIKVKCMELQSIGWWQTPELAFFHADYNGRKSVWQFYLAGDEVGIISGSDTEGEHLQNKLINKRSCDGLWRDCFKCFVIFAYEIRFTSVCIVRWLCLFQGMVEQVKVHIGHVVEAAHVSQVVLIRPLRVPHVLVIVNWHPPRQVMSGLSLDLIQHLSLVWQKDLPSQNEADKSRLAVK